jgi:AraC-like DNA-binding protein
MTSHKKFTVDLGWQVLAKDLNVALPDLLRHAHLPLDLLSRTSPTLTVEEYYRLWDSLGQLMGASTAALRVGQTVSVEAFSPPLFASFCSPNLNVALARLAQYKPLIGPLRLELAQDARGTTVSVSGLPDDVPAPTSLLAMELVFLVHLARLATRTHIRPLAVYMSVLTTDPAPYAAFFGVPITHAEGSGLTFAAVDAQRPFLTANDAMWSIFKPELRTRLHQLQTDAPFRKRVRACLMEILASGACAMADVAERLAVSTRTLQRKLAEEGTTFQQELNSLREELARHYLAASHYSGAEISFLLGYQDPNSFFRAFHSWTGQTPEAVRASLTPPARVGGGDVSYRNTAAFT